MLKNKLCAFLLAAALTPALAVADTVTLKADYPDRYIVQKGDTLWDISGRFLNEPWLWPEVWEANPQIENPHLIYPGDEVTLRYRDGRPIVTVGRRGGKGTVRLSPEVRVEELDTAIPTIPIDVIQQFLSRPKVVTEKQIDNAPYVVSVGREALIGKPGKKIYARGIKGRGGDKFSVYRKGQPYVVPKGGFEETDNVRQRGLYSMWIEGDGTETPPRGRESLYSMWIENDGRGRRTTVAPEGEILGYEAIHIADAVLTTSGDPSTLVVTGGNRELLAGDRLFPVADEEINTSFMPRAPSGNVSGQIISVVDGVSQIGQYQIVVLNLGARDGIKTGHVMAVYQRGETIEDPFAKRPVDQSMETGKSNVELDPDKQGGFEGFFKAVDDVVVEIHEGIAGRLSSRAAETIKLPDERAGTIMVFRPYDRFSYALVMEAKRSMHVNDAVKNP